jgi:WD40 repeat protein
MQKQAGLMRLAKRSLVRFAALMVAPCSVALADGPAPDYSSIDTLFKTHCLDCHAAQDPEGKLVLESFETLSQGGEIGAAIKPGNSADSLLVQMVEGRFEKDGKKKIMPPGRRKKLSAEEINAIRAWIDSGARGPSVAPVAKELRVPRIEPKGKTRKPVNALACSTEAKILAVARYKEVELRSVPDLRLTRTLAPHQGAVNVVVFSGDGATLFAAGGQPGVSGEVRQWNVADGKPLQTFKGHQDAIYALAVSPDGTILATGSYDQKIKLWDIATGKESKALAGHNGCVYDLAFRPDGKILASASADRTVKLWDVETGQRRDTLSQSQKEVFTVAFTPAGDRLLAGGADSRIRVWAVSASAAEGTNPILESRFAHEGAILNLVFTKNGSSLVSSADDRTVKLWKAEGLQESLLLEKQPDWTPAISFLTNDKVAIGRLDGTLAVYNARDGKPEVMKDAAPVQGGTANAASLSKPLREGARP